MKCPKCGHTPTLEERQQELETLSEVAIAMLTMSKRMGLSDNIETAITEINTIIKRLKKMQSASKMVTLRE